MNERKVILESKRNQGTITLEELKELMDIIKLERQQAGIVFKGVNI